MRTIAFNFGKHTRRVSFILFILATVFTSCSNDSSDLDEVYTTPEISTPAPPPAIIYSNIELQVLELVNAYRLENNLTKLETLDIISNVAETHTDYMISQQEASHDSFPERMTQLQDNASAKSVAENVAYGFRTAEGVMNGWLNSEGHKKNIDTAKFTHFGISTKSDANGRYYYTLMFIQQ